MCSIPTSAQRYAIPILYTGGLSFRQANAVLRRWKKVDKCWKWMKVEVKKYPQCYIHLWWCCLFILAVKFVQVYCIWALGSPIRLLCMWTLICEHFLLKWKAPFVVIHCRFNTGDLLLFYIVIGDSLQIFYCGWLWATGFNLRQKNGGDCFQMFCCRWTTVLKLSPPKRNFFGHDFFESCFLNTTCGHGELEFAVSW